MWLHVTHIFSCSFDHINWYHVTTIASACIRSLGLALAMFILLYICWVDGDTVHSWMQLTMITNHTWIPTPCILIKALKACDSTHYIIYLFVLVNSWHPPGDHEANSSILRFSAYVVALLCNSPFYLDLLPLVESPCGFRSLNFFNGVSRFLTGSYNLTISCAVL